MSVLLAALTYQDQPVRVLGTPDAPLFVAADVCAVLEIAEHRSATRDFEDDEKGVQTVHSPGGHAGVSKDAMAALWAMRQVGLVDFEEGPRHARRWFAVQQPQERIQ